MDRPNQRSSSCLNKTTQNVLKQLEENQALRIELFRVKTLMRDQHSHFLNSIVNQQMLASKIITQINLAMRRAKEVSQNKQEVYVLMTAMANSKQDIECLLQNYIQMRSDWSQNSAIEQSNHYEQFIHKCEQKYNCAQEAIEVLTLQKNQKQQGIQKLSNLLNEVGEELSKINHNYKLCLMDNAKMKEEVFGLINQNRTHEENQQKNSRQIQQLKAYNDHLSEQLRQSRQVAGRHIDYMKKNADDIEEENQKLVKLNRELMIKQNQNRKEIILKDQQNQELKQNIQKLKNQLQICKRNLKEIIDQEQKIKLLQTMKRKRQQQMETLQQIGKQNIQETQRIDKFSYANKKKEVGKMTKKFNLQIFQQKMSNSNASINFYPH